MSKQRKKIRCICRGKADRTVPGRDHSKHTPSCPIVTQQPRGGSL